MCHLDHPLPWQAHGYSSLIMVGDGATDLEVRVAHESVSLSVGVASCGVLWCGLVVCCGAVGLLKDDVSL